jgi:hypothetical protein
VCWNLKRTSDPAYSFAPLIKLRRTLSLGAELHHLFVRRESLQLQLLLGFELRRPKVSK